MRRLQTLPVLSFLGTRVSLQAGSAISSPRLEPGRVEPPSRPAYVLLTDCCSVTPPSSPYVPSAAPTQFDTTNQASTMSRLPRAIVLLACLLPAVLCRPVSGKCTIYPYLPIRMDTHTYMYRYRCLPTRCAPSRCICRLRHLYAGGIRLVSRWVSLPALVREGQMPALLPDQRQGAAAGASMCTPATSNTPHTEPACWTYEPP